MSVRLFACVSLLGLLVAPVAAEADGLVIPGLGPSDANYGRPTYRGAVFPPPQHGVFGQLEPLPPLDRPTYRQANNDFPPEGGRYGGGFLEYVLTGGRPEPLPEPAYAPRAYAAPVQYQPVPAYAATYNPAAALLPRSGLPDYVPQPPADAYNALSAQAAAPAPAYNTPGAAYDPSADPGAASRPIDPMFARQEVAYDGHERPGTIIIDTPEKFLFLIQPGGRALRYGIGVGRPGFTWAGIKRISRKAQWPDWTPPREMLLRRPDLPRHMVGGIGNPLGARAMYLGSSMYRIHGTNEPYTIGTNVSSGCIRMMNQDVEDLYGRVDVGTRVVVL